MISPVEAHLALNHLPVLGLPFAAGLLGAGFLFENAEWRRAGLWTAALTAVAAWVVYFSGGAAADALSGLDDRAVARHAELARLFAWAATGVGAAAVAALAKKRGAAAVLALALAASALGAATAHRGGLIRHAELKAAD